MVVALHGTVEVENKARGDSFREPLPLPT